MAGHDSKHPNYPCEGCTPEMHQCDGSHSQCEPHALFDEHQQLSDHDLLLKAVNDVAWIRKSMENSGKQHEVCYNKFDERLGVMEEFRSQAIILCVVFVLVGVPIITGLALAFTQHWFGL